MHDGQSIQIKASDTQSNAAVVYRLHNGKGIAPGAVVPSRYVLLSLATLLTGYTVKAMQRKIERGDWQQDKEWRRAPDGRIFIDLVGYEKWVESR